MKIFQTSRIQWSENLRSMGINLRLWEKRLDLPIFLGEDSEWWIYIVERHFSLYQMLEDDKFAATVTSFEGKALKWFKWEDHCQPIKDWIDLKNQLLDQFAIERTRSILQQFLEIKKSNFVVE